MNLRNCLDYTNGIYYTDLCNGQLQLLSRSSRIDVLLPQLPIYHKNLIVKMIMIPKKDLNNITTNKILFDKLLQLSTKPVKESERTKVIHRSDDCTDKQTHSRKSANT